MAKFCVISSPHACSSAPSKDSSKTKLCVSGTKVHVNTANKAKSAKTIEGSSGEITRKNNTCGALIEPMRPIIEHDPNAADRTIVGNNSVVYKYTTLKEPLMPNRPTKAKNILCFPFKKPLIKAPNPLKLINDINVVRLPMISTANCAAMCDGISTNPLKKLFI